jgi:hypothetical protein
VTFILYVKRVPGYQLSYKLEQDMSLATYLVTLNTKPLNLTKVAATQLASVKEGILFSLYLLI